MTMNLKKVFTSTSFNLSSVSYARFCAGSFYQEFDECRTFLLYKNFNEIKSHHYIISFDPKDREECGLTGERAQQLGLTFAKKNFLFMIQLSER